MFSERRKTLRVAYDIKNDVVSIYFDSDEIVQKSSANNSDIKYKERNYEVDEAANLILDMIDLLDNKGNFYGFRVFNASRHYDRSLLNSADIEELSKEELLKRPDEKIVAKISEAGNKIYAQ